MKTALLVMAVLSLSMIAAAKDNEMHGSIISENSVQCGSQAKGKTTSELMCQEYVIRTDTTEYHVRQQKQGQEMLPVNAPVQLTISKDKMKFKVNGKGYEMLIVSESAAAAGAPAAPKQ